MTRRAFTALFVLVAVLLATIGFAFLSTSRVVGVDCQTIAHNDLLTILRELENYRSVRNSNDLGELRQIASMNDLWNLVDRAYDQMKPPRYPHVERSNNDNWGNGYVVSVRDIGGIALLIRVSSRGENGVLEGEAGQSDDLFVEIEMRAGGARKSFWRGKWYFFPDD